MTVTYPGTVTPLRGLDSFAESERDVLFGRDREREELTRLVTADGFRAGLLYGEPGVGKTSLLRAGLAPHLRDHGIVALYCDDILHPIDSFAGALRSNTGLAPRDNEASMAYLVRVIGEAMSGQIYLFIIDEAELVLRDDKVIGELGDLFARAAARTAGRARFLFACATGRIHLFGALERRTGSLFPPSSRYELTRFEPNAAAAVLEQSLALAAPDREPQIAHEITAALAQRGPILPAELQVAAMALMELGIRTVAELQELGGAGELQRTWVSRVAAATGNERSALRLLAELDHRDGQVPIAAEWAAARANVDVAFARHALATLETKGVTRPVPTAGPEPSWVLAHEILGPKIREVAAAAMAAARRAFELLGSKAARKKRLTFAEWMTIRREGISPSTPDERAVIDRTRLLAYLIAAAAAAAPILLFILIYSSLSGHYYLDVLRDSGEDRVVVRAGRPGLSSFFWMPSSPGFGEIVADTGYSKAMVTPEQWASIIEQDVVFEGDDYSEAVSTALRPSLLALIEYAAVESETALESLAAEAAGPVEQIALLDALRPIARGRDREVELVEEALTADSAAVRRAALAVASTAALRKEGAYTGTLARALSGKDPELRRLAVASVRALDEDQAQELVAAALEEAESDEVRQELSALIVNAQASRPSAERAASQLATGKLEEGQRDKAREELTRAFRQNGVDATRAAAELLTTAEAPLEERIFAAELLFDEMPEEAQEAIAEQVSSALADQNPKLRAAVLPLYARVSPEKATGDLALMLENQELSPEMRAAMALAWGELARRKVATAPPAIEQLLEDKRIVVRAAAARAYGFVGRRAQATLSKLIKEDRADVARGAAYGLVNSVEVGAASGAAVGGIYQMWKQKGRVRRVAAGAYARMARKKPSAVVNYLASAATSEEDRRLHPIGVRGLCNGMIAGNRKSRQSLAKLADGATIEIRRAIVRCAVDNVKSPSSAAELAGQFIADADEQIRVEAAQVIATVAGADSPPQGVPSLLLRLAQDDARTVRMLAFRALATLGSGAPAETDKVLVAAFDSGDEAEKLTILEVAKAVGSGGPVAKARADASPVVREAALATAIGTNTEVVATINAALTDSNPGLRRAALRHLGDEKLGMDEGDVMRALSLAMRDGDPSISSLALTIFAQRGDLDVVTDRLGRALAARSEGVRAEAALASRGLAERDAQAAVDLLEPMLTDPSHDVRAALLPALSIAYARTRSGDRLEADMRNAEAHATQRLVLAGAFAVLAEGSGRESVVKQLQSVVADAAPLCRQTAKLTLGLIAGRADALEFLAFLVP